MIVGPLQFDAPMWLALIPPLWLVAWWIARKSLTGLGRVTRGAALTARFAVIALLLMAVAEPKWRNVSETVANVVVLDASKSMPPRVRERVDDFVRRASEEGAEAQDELGLVTAAEEAFVQAIPSRVNRSLNFDFVGDQEGTDLSAAVRLAMAVIKQDTAGRITLITDGNETAGSLLAAAQSAKAAGVPIDVLPIEYKFEREVILDRLIAPPTARRGQTVNLRFVLTATAPVRGRLSLLANDLPIDLDPEGPGQSVVVELQPGVNVQTVPLTLPRSGPQRYSAVFEPMDQRGDTIVENNAGSAVTFVSGEGRVLVYTDDERSVGEIVRALEESQIEVEVRPPAQAHQTLVDLSAYDALILADVSAYNFTQQQQDEMRAYVHDLGGGLVMVGGPNAFGAGGWIGSPLADALPVKLDPPQKRQMPRGALALIMHSCEVPQGNYWGQKTARAAVDALSSRDLVGVIEYDWNIGLGASWAYKMADVGDRTAVNRAIANLKFGDMPDFDSAFQLALNGLVNAAAGQKHCIVISDGDPSGPTQATIGQFVQNKITVSTVAVFPHSMGAASPDVQKMKAIAEVTGGQFYSVLQQNQLATLPQIFIKEAQTIKRSLIWEGDPFQPAFEGSLSEPMRGIGRDFPAISGYIVTAEREGLAQVTLRGVENDPILAQWQHGLGRSVAFTSDAATRWCPSWASWPDNRAFWEQHVRWAMRPSGSANVNVMTETQGDRTRVIVEAVDAEGERLNFANFRGRVVRPDMTAEAVELRQTGAGRYEGYVESAGAGAYVINLNYEAALPGGAGGAGGAPIMERGAVQAAITRPFADEHRALESNTALLRQVAELTGGRLLDPDPMQAEMYSRAGLTMPVALRSIWLAVAMIAIGVFLVDVAVRRVRIDVPAMVKASRKLLARQKKSSEKQIDALRTAREKAKGVFAKRTAGAGAEGDGEARGAAEGAKERAAETARVKFEADEAAVKRGRAGSVLDEPARAREGVKPAMPGAIPGAGAGKKEEEEEGMSRLMRAKKRARDSMKDDEQRDGQ